MTVIAAQARERIDAVLDLASGRGMDDECLAHWARYVCILCSGLVEVTLKAILREYTVRRSHPDVVNFVESRLEGIGNLNEERVYQLLYAFRPAWAAAFRSKRTDEQKAALDSVVANRNEIAHGRNVGLTLGRMRHYYREVCEVLRMIEKSCLK